MLVELGVVEQRYAAVREVLEGATVGDVARRNGVARKTVHDWLRKYATGGMAALVERSSKPARCAHQMAPAVEARVVELRRAHPGWGPRTILHRLASEGVDPLPGRSSVHRALVRHGQANRAWEAAMQSGTTTSSSEVPMDEASGTWTSPALPGRRSSDAGGGIQGQTVGKILHGPRCGSLYSPYWSYW